MAGNLVSAATTDDIPCFHCEVRDRTICASLETDELHRLNAIVAEIRLNRNQIIFLQDDPANHLFNVTAGIVRLSRILGDGRRQITGFLFPGDFLGVSYGDRYAYGAEAVVDVRLCRFPRERLLALFDDLPRLEHRLLAAAGNELAEAQEQMLLLGRKTAREKLVSFLIYLARRAAAGDRCRSAIDLPMTRTDIADYLGMTGETVSRVFATLAREGLIELPSSNRILLKDRDALAAIAEGF